MTAGELIYLLTVAVISGGTAYFGSYLRSAANQKAIEERIEDITELQEGVIHGFIEEREILKLKRSKIETAYLEILAEAQWLVRSLSKAASGCAGPFEQITDKVKMTVTLYLDGVADKELDAYLDVRADILDFTTDLVYENKDVSSANPRPDFIANTRAKQSDELLRQFTRVQLALQNALVAEMKKHTS